MVVAVIGPRGECDVRQTLHIGTAMLLDKPVIAVIKPGTRVPEKLARIVDRWIEADALASKETMQAIHDTTLELHAEYMERKRANERNAD